MVLCSIWLQLRARQDFLGSTLLGGPIKKEKNLTYVHAQNLKNLRLLHSRFFTQPGLLVFKQPMMLTKAIFCQLIKKM